MGYEAINNLGVVFTRTSMIQPPEEKCEMIQNAFKEIGIINVPDKLTCWCVDNNPKNTILQDPDTTEEELQRKLPKKEAQRDSTLNAII